MQPVLGAWRPGLWGKEAGERQAPDQELVLSREMRWLRRSLGDLGSIYPHALALSAFPFLAQESQVLLPASRTAGPPTHPALPPTPRKRGRRPAGRGSRGHRALLLNTPPIPPAAKPFKRNKGSRGRGRGSPLANLARVLTQPRRPPGSSGFQVRPSIHIQDPCPSGRGPPNPGARTERPTRLCRPEPRAGLPRSPPTPALAPGGFRSLLTVRCSAGSSRTHFLCLFLSLSLLQPLVLPPRPIRSGSFQPRERILLNGVCTESTHTERAHTHTHSHPAVAPNQCPNLGGGSPSSLRL